MVSKWNVYIVECLDGSYYTGVAIDVEKRIKKHVRGIGSKYVQSKGFKKIIAIVPNKTRSEACKIEYAIKQFPRSEKLEQLKKYI